MKRGYFNLWELVSKSDYEQHGAYAWRFVCPALLGAINRIRENLGKPITANTWYTGGSLQWRGVRNPSYSGYSVTSMHAWGRALDFDVKDLTPEQVVRHIIFNQALYPEITFIEIDISWVHIDTGQREDEHDGLRLWSPEREYVDIDTYLKETSDVH